MRRGFPINNRSLAEMAAPKKAVPLTEEQKVRARRLRKEGATYVEIARQIGRRKEVAPNSV